MCGCDCVCEWVGVIVWVGVGVIGWVRKGVCGWYSLNCCCKVCMCVLGGSVYLKKARSLEGSVLNCQEGLKVAAVKSGLRT